MKENIGHVEVFAGTKQLLDCIADLECRLARYALRSARAAEHGIDVFHISKDPPRSKCNVVRPRRIGLLHLRQFFPTVVFALREGASLIHLICTKTDLSSGLRLNGRRGI